MVKIATSVWSRVIAIKAKSAIICAIAKFSLGSFIGNGKGVALKNLSCFFESVIGMLHPTDKWLLFLEDVQKYSCSTKVSYLLDQKAKKGYYVINQKFQLMFLLI